jgi:hypothetical protein
MQRGRTALITSVAHITVPQSSVSRTMVHQPYRAAQTGRTSPLSSTPHHFPGLSNLVLMTDSYVSDKRSHPHTPTHARTHARTLVLPFFYRSIRFPVLSSCICMAWLWTQRCFQSGVQIDIQVSHVRPTFPVLFLGYFFCCSGWLVRSGNIKMNEEQR